MKRLTVLIAMVLFLCNNGMASIEIYKKQIVKSYPANLIKWRNNPIEYKNTILQSPKYHKDQEDVFNAVFKYGAVACSTYNSFGKSLLASDLMLTIPNLWTGSKADTATRGMVLAPTFSQVRDIIFANARATFEDTKQKTDNMFPMGDMTTTRYNLNAASFVVGKSPRLAAKGAPIPQFVHGMHGKVVFIIVDEACAVADQVFAQIEKIKLSGKKVYILFIGNPININSHFGDLFHTPKGDPFYTMKYHATSNPNMVANGLTSLDKIEQFYYSIRDWTKEAKMKLYNGSEGLNVPYPNLLSPGYVISAFARWGKSPYFKANVMGMWQENLEGTKIPMSRMQELMQGQGLIPLDIENPNSKMDKVWLSEYNHLAKYDGDKTIYSGIDCADDGIDLNVLFAMIGNKEIYKKKFTKTWEKNDRDYQGTQLVQDGKYIAEHWVMNVFDKAPNNMHILYIDATGGFGNSLYQALMLIDRVKRSQFVTIRRLKYSEAATDKTQYKNITSEMFIEYANAVNSEHGILFAELDEDLANESTNRRFKTDGGVYVVESKKEYKQRTSGISPDTLDAVMMANYARVMSKHSARDEFETMANRPKKQRTTKLKGRF